ncbi:uncharacterized protein MKK02DRAFT_40564 [Dioszegia hungarica]|uniref:Uncharacterized protein n=1 Tax=Dioszegia hungarica TaxID=4972 RepID=A0AA38H1I8_9TREE|nr:uncharacterized protein MKK02DRAFT_40564 [Dioszegia hungarica]KAI9632260.1 hypothetical protein MKK02DRAFT_40564 [Dioszegia hungarica]
MSSASHITPLSAATILPLLAQPPSSALINDFLLSLSSSPSNSNSTSSTVPPEPTVKSYPDAQYHTYLPLGLDLIYSPSSSSPSAVQWELDRIDIYNPVPGVSVPSAGSSRRRAPPMYTPPALPLVTQLARAPVVPPQPAPPAGNSGAALPTVAPAAAEATLLEVEGVEEGKQAGGRPEPFLITSESIGREFVSALGEPSRKGGAQGWVGPWLEWADLKILVPRRRSIQADVEPGQGGTSMEEAEDMEEVGIGLMVELRDGHKQPTEEEMKKGLGGVWDRAAGWGWGCVKIFRVGSTT